MVIIKEFQFRFVYGWLLVKDVVLELNSLFVVISELKIHMNSLIAHY